MPKIFIVSNTLFGNKNHLGFSRFLEESEKYFTDELIPFIKLYAKPDDIFVHLGGMFSSKQSINIKAVNVAQRIIQEISCIIPVYLLVGDQDRYQTSNDINSLSVFKNISNVTIITDTLTLYSDKVALHAYTNNISQLPSSEYLLFCNDPNEYFDYTVYFSRYKNVYTGYNKKYGIDNNIIFVNSPYQTEPSASNNGIYVLDIDKCAHKLLPNKNSTKFKTLEINSIQQLKSLDKNIFNKNFIDIVVDKSLFEDLEFKIGISEYNIQSIKCKEEIVSVNTNKEDIKIFNVDELVYSIINKNIEMREEFENIVSIHNKNLQ